MGNGIQLHHSFWAPRYLQSSVPVEQCQCDPWASADLVWWIFFSQVPRKISWAPLFQGKDSCRSAARSDKVCHLQTLSYVPVSLSWPPLFPCTGVIHSGLLPAHSVSWGLPGEQDLSAAPTRPSVRSERSCGGKNGRRPHFPGFICQYLWKSFSKEYPCQKKTPLKKAPHIR